jgi:hypothetical protein
VTRSTPGAWHRLFEGAHLGGWRRTGPALEVAQAPERLVRLSKGGVVINVLPVKLPAEPAGAFEQMHQALAGVQWVRDFPASDYEVLVEATCLGGNGVFCGMSFPVGATRWSVSLGGEGSKGEVLLTPTEDAARAQQGTCGRLALVRGRWYRLRLQVRGGRVQAWVNGKDVRRLPPVVGHRITGPYGAQGSGRFQLGARCTRAALRNVLVRRLPAAGEPNADGQQAP